MMLFNLQMPMLALTNNLWADGVSEMIKTVLIGRNHQ